ncbi:SDR family oxidoreductase [Sporocytophaga myxococcoides]|uniref:SDR family oxidoreductase n=1 Tax=Sporocytophaga myxococcoides TaxID=153721 RepID=UPI000421B8DB|nr:SDR family oxidoreductase [Sporocytophaga myxococcoides]
MDTGFIKKVYSYFKDEVPKVVVITGASAGLGRSIVREYAKLGCSIALLARGEDGLLGAKEEVENLGGQALIKQVDVADAAKVEEVAEEIENQLGPIDVWINNAMVSVFSPISEMLPEEYKRVTEVTYLGQVYGTLAALKRMRKRNKGSIIFVGSALAYRGIPLQSAYCAAKHAIEGFYDALRAELIHDKSKIKTCMVQLPAMNTTQFELVKSRLPHKAKPMGKIYQPEVAARAIVYAAKHNRREIYVGYPTVYSILGNKIAPWLGDYVLAKEGYTGQQTDIKENPERLNNLYTPVPGDHGSHGSFDNEAASKSTEVWLSMNKSKVFIGLGVITTIAWILKLKMSRTPKLKQPVLNNFAV